MLVLLLHSLGDGYVIQVVMTGFYTNLYVVGLSGATTAGLVVTGITGINAYFYGVNAVGVSILSVSIWLLFILLFGHTSSYNFILDGL